MVKVIVDGKSFEDLNEAAKVIGNGTVTDEIYNALVFMGVGAPPETINGHTVCTALT